jgi:hypothetical protein
VISSLREHFFPSLQDGLVHDIDQSIMVCNLKSSDSNRHKENLSFSNTGWLTVH